MSHGYRIVSVIIGFDLSMSAPASAEAREVEQGKPGLIFDADSVTLLGKFTDEFSAHRAKKQWMGVFAHHFLLERSRDYDMEVGNVEGTGYYYLRSTFESACGRYAFWRLVNHQAMEAEQKLQSPNMVNKKVARFLLGSVWNVGNGGPWVMHGEGPTLLSRRGTGSILRSMIDTIHRALHG